MKICKWININNTIFTAINDASYTLIQENEVHLQGFNINLQTSVPEFGILWLWSCDLLLFSCELLQQTCDRHKVSRLLTVSMHSNIHFHTWFINYKANNGFSSSSFCSFLDLWPVVAAMVGRVSGAWALSARNESNSEHKTISSHQCWVIIKLYIFDKLSEINVTYMHSNQTKN